MYANDSDNDGDDLCDEVVGPSWNPEGVAMPTSFTNTKAILAAVDNLAIHFNKEVSFCVFPTVTRDCQHYRPTVNLIVLLLFYVFPHVSIRNGRSGLVAIRRCLYANISSKRN
jgi:hypothetical protein